MAAAAPPDLRCSPAWLLAAARWAWPPAAEAAGREHAPERGDRAVAKVDGQTVWSSDVKREAVAQGLIGEGEPLDVSSDLFRRVLDEVVDQRLLAGEAVRRKLDKDPVAQRRLAAARDRVLGDMLVESVVSDAVNDNAVRGLYQEQLKLAKRSEEIHARQIVVATAAEARGRAQAAGVRGLLRGAGHGEVHRRGHPLQRRRPWLLHHRRDARDL